MRFADIIVVGAVLALFSILIVNTVFLRSLEFVNNGANINRTVGEDTVVDENSTFYDFASAPPPSEVSIDTQNTIPTQPAGWMKLTVTIPFNISKDSRKIDFSTVFSIGTDGGVKFFWTVDWRLYNNSFAAASDNLSNYLEISADTIVTNSRSMDSNLDENNISLCQPGRWYYEGTLTIHNATLFSSAQFYRNCYNLLVEIDGQGYPTSASNERSVISATISGAMVLIIPLFYVAEKARTHGKHITKLSEFKRATEMPRKAQNSSPIYGVA